MPSQTKQDKIKFPVCKTRTSARLSKKNVERQKNIHIDSPTKKVQTPRKKKIDVEVDQENNSSPPKKNCTYDGDNIARNCHVQVVDFVRTPLKSLRNSYNKNLAFDENPSSSLHVSSSLNLFSPKKFEDSKIASENEYKSPKKNFSPDRNEIIKNNKVQTIQFNDLLLKSPKTKSNSNTPLKENENFVTNGNVSRALQFCSPAKVSLNKSFDDKNKSPSAHRINRTPNKSEISSPLKTSKSSVFESPVRRSPRKLTFENSPSSLISKLSVSSPKPVTSTIGLQKSELKAYQALKTSFAQNTNNKIVGRDTEVEFLEKFLKDHLETNTPGSLYISGAPGTGKTALVTNLMNNLSKDHNFKQVFLNCMSKASSREIFAPISASLKLSCRTEREMIAKIEKTLTTSKSPIIIVLDEVDQLESKDQNILYTLFEWPALENSKLILVGIANMLDLTDRILPRLQSLQTFRPKLLHFPPYSKAEIIQIINERIREANIDVQIFKPSAIQFLAGKISSVAGDVRKALDVCRRSVELCELQARRQMRLVAVRSPSKSPRKKSTPVLKQVDIPQILSICNEIYGSRVTTEITDNPNTFPLQQKVLICSLLLIIKHSKTKNTTLGKFHEVYSRVCSRQKLPSVEQSEFFSLCTLLESRGMLQVKKSKELRNSKIILRLNEEEAQIALGDKVLLATILEDTASLSKTNK